MQGNKDVLLYFPLNGLWPGEYIILIGIRKKAVILFLLFAIVVSNLSKEEIEAF